MVGIVLWLSIKHLSPLNSPSPMASDLGHVTCFGQWDIWRYATSRGFICACALGLVLWHTLSWSSGCSSQPSEHCRHVRRKPLWRSSPSRHHVEQKSYPVKPSLIAELWELLFHSLNVGCFDMQQQITLLARKKQQRPDLSLNHANRPRTSNHAAGFPFGTATVT